MTARPERLLSQLRRLVRRPTVEPASDGDLLERFVCHGDEDAFAVLVERHGAMVLGVCRRTLGDRHAAEDAFQAVWLVLAKKADTLRPRGTLAGWLYGVARQVASRALRAEARRRRRDARADRSGKPGCEPDPLDALTARELLLIVDEEVQRLPETYRLPVILCALEGLTQDAAARQLGCTASSLKNRLDRGRARLRQRLMKRGVAWASALLVLQETPAGAAGKVAPALAAATVRAAQGFFAGSLGGAATPAMLLAEETMRSGALAVLKACIVTLCATGLVAVAAGGLAQQARLGLPPEAQAEPEPQAAQAPSQREEPKTPPRVDRYGDPLPDGAVARIGSIRLHHGGPITNLRFTPNGKALIAGDAEFGIARLWHAATGKEIRQFGKSSLLYESSSSNGVTLATAARWGIELFDVDTGKHIRTFPFRQLGFMSKSVLLTPEGKHLLVGNEDRRDGTPSIYLLDATTGDVLRQFTGHKKSITELALSPTGKTFASGSEDGAILLWDIDSGKELHELLGHGGPIRSIAFSPDNRILASAGGDKNLRLWEVTTGKERYREPLAVNSVAFSPNGSQLAATAYYWEAGKFPFTRIHLWDARTLTTIRRIQTAYPVGPLAFSPDGKRLAGGGISIWFWDVLSGQEVNEDPQRHLWAGGITLSPNGTLLATLGFGKPQPAG
jgi:RNA polymerase sigma factor (sigma-70 family)